MTTPTYKPRPMSSSHQARRQRALERFTIDEEKAKKDPEYAERKAVEHASLLATLGRTTP